MKILLQLLRNKTTWLFIGILFSVNAFSLVSNYTFTQSAGVYTAVTGGTVLGDSLTNNANFPANGGTPLPIGFTFYFNGLTKTDFSVNANGYVVLGNLANSSTTVISSGGGNSNTNVVSALNYDIQSSATGDLQYKTIGAAPNRTLVVQWTNFRSAGTTGEILNFQIRLNEGSNSIDIRYGNLTVSDTVRAQIGLKGNSNADFNNRAVGDTVVNTWATSIAGTANNSRCQLSPTFKPTSGQTYSWAPPTPPQPPTTMTFTAVTPTGMTVNWIDNSTDETYFSIYRSTDNINFTYFDTVVSNTTAATGGAYSLPAGGLNSATLYYWRIYSFANTPSTTYLSGSQSTLTGTICGNKTIGPTGDYTSIRAAITALQTNGLGCAVILELQAAYISTVDTPFPVVVPFLGCTAINTLTLRPMTGAVNLKLLGRASQILDLSGATYFTIDGRAGGTGTTRNLMIYDSSATGSALRFVNDAHHNTLNYLDLRGSARGGTTTGVVTFGNATTGNSNNTISNCDFSKGDTAQIMLYSNTNGGANSNNTVTNNNFHDWFALGASNYGISLGASNEAWTITNNNFYQASAQTFSSTNTHAAINITGGGGGTSGSGFVITGNFIGGSAPACGGSAWTYNGLSGTFPVGPRFTGIALSAGTDAYSSIQGNTIKNFNITSSAPAGGGGGTNNIFSGINISAGNVNVGTTTANTIGSTTANNSIVTTASANAAQSVGITCSSGDTVVISGNSIGGISANDSSAANSTNCVGINVSNGNMTISNNYIGSNTLANNMVNGASTSTGGLSSTVVYGIQTSNTDTCNITGNTIKNIANLNRGGGTSVARGIGTSGGSNFISGNTVEYISNYSSQTGTNTSATVQGISQYSANPGQAVISNIVRYLLNKSDTGNVGVTGIYFTADSAGNNYLRKNRIYGIAASSTNDSTARVTGIQIAGGSYIVDNNMVSLGTDTAGTSYAKAHEYTGILRTGAGSTIRNKIVYNSVSVSGTGVVNKTVNTFAFRRTGSGVDSLRNNIFANSRSNVSTGGSHYSIALTTDTGAISDKNCIWGNGTGYVTGLLNTTPANSLFAWFSAAHIDSNSIAVDPRYTSAKDLHINNTFQSGIESKGYTISGITTDYDGQVRPGPAGSVNGGATAPDIGADEFDGIPINIDMGAYALSKPSVVGCHSATDSVRVTIKNYTSVTLNFVTNPVAIYASVTGPNPLTFPVVNVNTGTLAGGATRTVTIAYPYSMAAAGTYVFNAYTVTTGDLFPTNDTLPPVTIQVSGGTASPSRTNTCAGLPVTLSVAGNVSGGTIQWQSSPNQTTWTNIAGATLSSVTVSPSANTYYRAVTCATYNSTIDTIYTTTVASPNPVTGATRCGPGQVTLHATSANPVMWFDSASNGTLVDTGSVFTTFVSASRSFYASASGNISAPKTLPTMLTAGFTRNGVMFPVTALTNITVTGFDCHATADTGLWAIYYRKDDITNNPGAANSSAGWMLIDSVNNVISAGQGAYTTIPINMSITIPAGKTYSFYVTLVTNRNKINYSAGSGVVGTVNTQNSELQVKDGYGGDYFNLGGVGRAFNGVVHYKTSCLSNRIAASVTVTAPTSINAVATPTTVCDGDSVHLTVTSSNANYRYTWSPTADLSDSTGTSIYAHPNGNSSYYVQAHDSVSGCNNQDTVSVTGTSLPNININVSNDSICTGDTLHLNVDLPVSYTLGGGGNQSNQPTTFPAPYGNSNFGSRHQMLILASELQAANMHAGWLNSLTFQVTDSAVGGALTNFTIRIGNTNVNALTDTFQTTATTQVFTTPAYTPVFGLNTHIFTTLFHWNGTSNIIIQTCFNNTTATVNARMRYVTKNFDATTYVALDSANNCTHTTGITSTRRPYMRLGIRNQFRVLWTSTVHVSDSSIANPWALPASTAMYHVAVTDTITGCRATDSLNVVVDVAPIVNLGNDTTVCGSILLDAGHPGDDYLWNDSTTNQTLVADTTGTYSVYVTHLQSCSASDTIHVSVLPIPAVSLALPYDTLCYNAPVQVLSGGTPAGGTFAGSGVTGTNFDPSVPPLGVVVITYTYTDPGNGCSNIATDDVYVDICNGLKTVSSDGLVKIYPNPVSDQLMIDLSMMKEKCIAQLVTPEGQIAANWVFQGYGSYPVDLDNLAEGIYFLKISNSNSNYVIRLVKQN